MLLIVTEQYAAKRTGVILIADLTAKPAITENYMTIPYVDDSGERVT